MGQNHSSAVMQQRSEPHHSLDDFPTPPWATRALWQFLVSQGLTAGGVAREPAANRGHMVRVLAEIFDHVDAADVHDYGAGFPVRDYLFGPDPAAVDWTISNPPFKLAEQFIARALRTSRDGCAFLVRSAFLEGQKRYEDLFSQCPPAFVLQFAERVVMHKGRLAPKGSTATAYCWVVFLADHRSGVTEFHWVPPCRAKLERDGDYPDGGLGLAEVDEGVLADD
ncbi:hypothetical protein [Leisingera sp.]|uniref:hypothetical protein n=1 Tax=Leisingera sp. TaxID=1879318 RepID=UPI002B279B50|nr:hypothetical protein [Leisingera sp.]